MRWRNCKKRLHFHGVCPLGTTRRYHWTNCNEIWCSRICRKSVENLQVSSNLTRITGTSHEYLCIFWLNLDQLFLEWKMFQSKFVEKIKTQILCSVTPPPPHPKIKQFIRKCEKNMVQPDNHAWKSNAALKMRSECRITRARRTQTHSRKLIFFEPCIFV
jgi:hypothetical protein